MPETPAISQRTNAESPRRIPTRADFALRILLVTGWYSSPRGGPSHRDPLPIEVASSSAAFHRLLSAKNCSVSMPGDRVRSPWTEMMALQRRLPSEALDSRRRSIRTSDPDPRVPK